MEKEDADPPPSERSYYSQEEWYYFFGEYLSGFNYWANVSTAHRAAEEEGGINRQELLVLTSQPPDSVIRFCPSSHCSI